MTVYSGVLTAILPLFGLIFLGYIAKKTRLLYATDAPVLNRFVINVTLPAFVFHALMTNHLKANLIVLPVIFWISESLILILAIFGGRLLKWPGKAIGTLILLGMFGNTGYMGYPMCLALMPLRLPAAVIIDQLGMGVMLYPGAIAAGGTYGSAEPEHPAKSFLKFFKTPIFVALVLGIVLRLIPASLVPGLAQFAAPGRIVMTLIQTIGSATVPVVLIAVGILLRPSSLPEHGARVVSVGFLKLIALPILTWAVARFLFHVSGTLLEICVLQAAMPPSASATVFAGQYDLDGNLAVGAFFALTIASALTIPLMLGLLH